MNEILCRNKIHFPEMTKLHKKKEEIICLPKKISFYEPKLILQGVIPAKMTITRNIAVVSGSFTSLDVIFTSRMSRIVVCEFWDKKK